MGGMLGRVIPPFLLKGFLGSDRDLYLQRVRSPYLNLILINGLPLHVDLTAILIAGRHHQALGFLAMLYHNLTVGYQRDLLLEGVLVLWKGFLVLGLFLGTILRITALYLCISLLHRLGLSSRFGRLFLEALVGLLQEGDMVIERLHIERPVDIQVTVIRNGITKRGSILHIRTTQP